MLKKKKHFCSDSFENTFVKSPDMTIWCYFSAAVSDSQLIQAVREVKVVDIGVNSFTLSWGKTPGASGYKISWIPFLGKGPHTQSTMRAYTLILTHVCTQMDTHSHLIQYLPKCSSFSHFFI